MTVLDILNEAAQALDEVSQLDESMYQHNIVVRWNNGDLEGFAGTALSGARKAKESAEAKANRKAKMIKKEFSILDGKEFAQLDSAQKKRLKRDWELSQKMDESKEIIQEDNKKVLEFKYKGLDCYVKKWSPFSQKPLYTAHNDDLEIYTKRYDTKEEAIEELKDMIDESIKDRDSEIKEDNTNKDETDSFESEVNDAKKLDHKFVNKIDNQVKSRIENWNHIASKTELDTDAHNNATYYEKIWQKISSILDDEFLSKPLKEEKEEDVSIDTTSEEFKKNEKEIAKELVASLSVFLFSVEKMLGQEFESAKQAEDFVFSAFRSLRTREKGVLNTMLRRFDRIGGERMANMFRRTLTKDLAK